MADFYISTGNVGQSVTVKLFNNGTQVGADIALTEIATAGGSYFANVPALTAAGHYLVNFYVSGVLISSGQINWDGTKEITHTPSAAEIAAAVLDSVE